MAAGTGQGRTVRGRGRRNTLTSSNTGTFTMLDCHCLRSEGSIGDEVYCSRHGRVARIIEAAPEWVIACTGCSWTKKHGLAQLTAVNDARRHSRRRRHRVQVFHGAKLIEEIPPRADGQELTLFNGNDTTQGA
jgi:hypothetical protein